MAEDQCILDGTETSNLGVAFGIVAAAGMTASLGGALAFVLPYKDEKINLWLAVSLSVAAGVMIYVSFAEIFTVKAVEAFTLCMDDSVAYLTATAVFFGGALICWAFDVLMEKVDKRILARLARKEEEKEAAEIEAVQAAKGEEIDAENAAEDVAVSNDLPPGLDTAQDIMPQDAAHNVTSGFTETRPIGGAPFGATTDQLEPSSSLKRVDLESNLMHEGQLMAAWYSKSGEAEGHSGGNRAAARRSLARIGVFAAIAIGFHNFPEGLATFVAGLNDPRVAASVAIAIGIHNIPEGICVAVPIFYATGSRWKGFMWATFSGITEVFGALIGWAVVSRSFNQIIYGVLFSLVGGMMVYISLAELLPTAHKYDPNDRVVTFGLIGGMAIMAVSLVLFRL